MPETPKEMMERRRAGLVGERPAPESTTGSVPAEKSEAPALDTPEAIHSQAVRHEAAIANIFEATQLLRTQMTREQYKPKTTTSTPDQSPSKEKPKPPKS